MILLFAGLNPHRQPIIRRRQRAGGVRSESARRIDGLVEIEHHAAFLGQGRVEETASAVGFATAGLIAKNVKQLLCIRRFEDRVEA